MSGTPIHRAVDSALATLRETEAISAAVRAVTIDNWIIIAGHIYGNVTWHPTMPDGSFVRTSALATSQDEFLEGDTIMTQYTTYTLGKPAGQF